MKNFLKNNKFTIILVLIQLLFLPLNIKEVIKLNKPTYEIILACIFSLITNFLLGKLIDYVLKKDEQN